MGSARSLIIFSCDFFEDFFVGQELKHSTPRTISSGDVSLFIGLLGSRFVLHSSKEFAKKLLDIGCYISVSGIITFKNSHDLSDAISSIPIKNLLVETDSPYLAPVPYRGKSNEPSYIIHTVEKLSQIKNLPKESIMKYTTNNFKKLFNLN